MFSTTESRANVGPAGSGSELYFNLGSGRVTYVMGRVGSRKLDGTHVQL